MNDVALIVVCAVTVVQALAFLFRDRDVMPAPPAADPTPRLRLGVYVGQHALARARQRFGDDTTAVEIARDVTEALTNERHGKELPAGAHTTRRLVRGTQTEFVWNHRLDRIYVIETGPKHVTVITALPPGHHAHDTTSLLEALREALQRYGG